MVRSQRQALSGEVINADLDWVERGEEGRAGMLQGSNQPLTTPKEVNMDPTKRCELCGHSRAAHADGVQCALCHCRSERPEVVQQAFTFRGVITTGRNRGYGRKR